MFLNIFQETASKIKLKFPTLFSTLCARLSFLYIKESFLSSFFRADMKEKTNNKETCACNNYDDKTLITVLCIFINAMTRKYHRQQQQQQQQKQSRYCVQIFMSLCICMNVYCYYCCHRDERRT